jgi:hypothetical protein
MMDDRSANFGAAQYTVKKYSNFTLDDNLLNLMGKMNNAVHLISSERQNAVPHWAFEFNSVPAVKETWGLKGQILRSGRMWSRIILMHHLWI